MILRHVPCLLWLLLAGALTSCARNEESPGPPPAAPPAADKSAPPSADASGPPDGGLSEIVVTGTHRNSEVRWHVLVHPTGTFDRLVELAPDQELDLTVQIAAPANSPCPDEVTKRVSASVDLESPIPIDLVLLTDSRYVVVKDSDLTHHLIVDKGLLGAICHDTVAARQALATSSLTRFQLKVSSQGDFVSQAVLVALREGRPVDQIAFQICSPTCPETENPIGSVGIQVAGFFPLLSSSKDVPHADASMYLGDISPEVSAGVIAIQRDDGSYTVKSWSYGTRLASIQAKLTKYVGIFDKQTDRIKLQQAGWQLGKAIFPTRAASNARTFLERYISGFGDIHPGKTPDLFVRIANVDPSDVVIFPVGLISLDDSKKSGKFWGQLARISIPLPNQNYSRGKECAQSVITLVPPRVPNMDAAISAALDGMTIPVLAKWQLISGSNALNSIASALKWTVDHENADIDQPSALIFLGHHYAGTWSFGDPATTIESDAFAGITFSKPSWAVLNGCSTAGVPGQVGGDGFLQTLNADGVQAVIVSHSEVEGALAGTYFLCLDQVLGNHQPSDEYSLGQAHFDAVECVWHSPSNGVHASAGSGVISKVWGPNALKYVLAGNGNLRACGLRQAVAHAM
jgi:hypothetical protein